MCLWIYYLMICKIRDSWSAPSWRFSSAGNDKVNTGSLSPYLLGGIFIGIWIGSKWCIKDNWSACQITTMTWIWINTSCPMRIPKWWSTTDLDNQHWIHLDGPYEHSTCYLTWREASQTQTMQKLMLVDETHRVDGTETKYSIGELSQPNDMSAGNETACILSQKLSDETHNRLQDTNQKNSIGFSLFESYQCAN